MRCVNLPGLPSIVPDDDDRNVYIVLDDFGRTGRAYRETDAERADLEAIIRDMLEGQHQNPVRMVGITPPKNGHRMSQAMLPKSCAADATCKCATCHPSLRTLFNAMTGSSTGN
jgi:hypothetical protein